MAPTNTIKMEQTVVNTGRLMKLSAILRSIGHRSRQSRGMKEAQHSTGIEVSPVYLKVGFSQDRQVIPLLSLVEQKARSRHPR